jgi:hypothetical protein
MSIRPGQAKGPWVGKSSGTPTPDDHKVLNSATDTTADYLGSKVVTQPLSGILLTTLNPGGDEKLQVEVDGSLFDDTSVSITGADQTTGFLAAKLVAGANVSLTVVNPGLSETLRVDAVAGSGDHKVMVEGADALAEYLSDKITTAGGLTATTYDKGAGVEGLSISGAAVVGTTTAANVGLGAGQVFRDKVGADINLKTIKAGPNVTVTNNANDVTIAFTDSDTYKVKNTSADTTENYLASKLAAGTDGITLTTLNAGGNEQTRISNSLTGVNAGTGLGKVFKSKTTTNLNFKSIAAGAGISVTNGTDDVTVACTITDTDTKVKASATDTTSGYLDAATTGGKIATEGLSLEIHAGSGDEQLNIYQIPPIYDEFRYSLPFWQGTAALTSADWSIDTANTRIACIAANNATDWIRKAIAGDFDYFFLWEINGATTVGFQVAGAGNTIQLKWSGNVITRTMTTQANQTQAFTPAAGFIMLRIKRTGDYIRFFYRNNGTERWTEFAAADYVLQIGMDVTLSLISVVSGRIKEMGLWDARMPQSMNGVQVKEAPQTDGATITPNITNGNLLTVTLGGNRTIAAPTAYGIPNGGMFILRLCQDASPPRTVTWNAIYRFPGGTTPTLTAVANKTDYFGFIYNATDTKYDCIAQELNL